MRVTGWLPHVCVMNEGPMSRSTGAIRSSTFTVRTAFTVRPCESHAEYATEDEPSYPISGPGPDESVPVLYAYT